MIDENLEHGIISSLNGFGSEVDCIGSLISIYKWDTGPNGQNIDSVVVLESMDPGLDCVANQELLSQVTAKKIFDRSFNIELEILAN